LPATVLPATVLPATGRALLYRVAREQADSRIPALAAGVIRDGALVWTAGRGRVGDAPPTASTQYRIGSITKTFVAVLVARLRDEGRLDFADPLDRHVPGTALGDRTIAQLLSHTSGLQAETEGPWWERTPGGSWSDLAAQLRPEAIRHRAGRRHHYSNVGFAILGEVVARHRGRSWWECLRAEILDPLDMRRTTYLPEPPYASGFAVHPWADVLLPEPAHDAGAMAAAGQLWSTVADLGRWAAFVAGDTGDVLSADTLAELREPNIVEQGAQWVSGYGLGFQIQQRNGRTLVGHGGSMPGFLAQLWVDVDEAVGAVALANTTSGLGPVASDLIEILLQHEPRLPDEWTPLPSPPDGLLDLVGTWYWGPTGFILRARGRDELELTPIAHGTRASRFRRRPDGTWVGLDGYYAGETLRIVRGPDGRVSHLDLASFIFTRAPYDPSAPIPGGVAKEGWTGGGAAQSPNGTATPGTEPA